MTLSRLRWGRRATPWMSRRAWGTCRPLARSEVLYLRALPQPLSFDCNRCETPRGDAALSAEAVRARRRNLFGLPARSTPRLGASGADESEIRLPSGEHNCLRGRLRGHFIFQPLLSTALRRDAAGRQSLGSAMKPATASRSGAAFVRLAPSHGRSCPSLASPLCLRSAGE